MGTCGSASKLSDDDSKVVCFVGLNNSGKSHIIHSLLNEGMYDEYVSVSTCLADYHELPLGSTYLKLIDTGGQGRYRCNWIKFIDQSDAVIFVIDKTDHERMSVVKDEIQPILQQCANKNKPCLIMANKCDLDRSLSISNIEAITQASKSLCNYKIIESSAKNGDGLKTGKEWIIKQIRGIID